MFLLSACGRSAGPKPFFPIGLYEVEDAKALAAIKDAGFNAIQTYDGRPAHAQALAQAARHEGLRLLVPPSELLASTISVRGWPLAAWYLADEPDVAKTEPRALAALDTKVKAWSPGAPTALVVGDGRAAKRYAADADVLMVDWYPVPHLPLTSVGDHVRWTVEAAKGKPVWAVLQAMDWREYPQRDPKKRRIGRFPDMSEIRFMTYDSIIEGARGLWYFTYTRPSGLTLADMPEWWFALTRVVHELALLEPVLAEGERLGPPRIMNEGLKGLVIRYRGRDYYMLANVAARKVLLPAYYQGTRFLPLFETRRMVEENLDQEKGGAWLAPGRVLVLEDQG